MDDAAFIEQRDGLLQSIEQDEQEVRVAVHELTGAARVKLDVSEHIKESPLMWLLGGFLVGLFLGSHRPQGETRERRRT